MANYVFVMTEMLHLSSPSLAIVNKHLNVRLSKEVNFVFDSWNPPADRSQGRHQDTQPTEDQNSRCRRKDPPRDPESQTLPTPAHHQTVSAIVTSIITCDCF